jgi:hypothetical protein
MIFFGLLMVALVCAQPTTPRPMSTTLLGNTTSTKASPTTAAAATPTGCQPGLAPCVCDTGMRCYSGVCQENMCINVRNASCVPAPDSSHPDVCMLYDQEFGAFSCQDGMCKSCTTGARHCACRSGGTCSDPMDKCEPFGPKNRSRCFPRTGCVGCPCVRVTNACDDGLCVSGVCTLPTTTTTPRPTTTTRPVCPASDMKAWNTCDMNARKCYASVSANVTICDCYVTYVSCISVNPADCPYFVAVKNGIQNACHLINCTSCEPTPPPAPTLPNVACDNARVERRAMCTYPGSMSEDTQRLVMAAQVGVISAVTMRICASLRAYLVCSRRILEAGTCDTAGLDIDYSSLGGRTMLCSFNKTAALLKDIECDMCTALTEPLVMGEPATVPGGGSTAALDTGGGCRLSTVLGAVLATAVFLQLAGN